MLTVLSVSNPIYADASGDAIDVTLHTAEQGAIPSTCMASDPETATYFNNAKAGQYGAIAAYVAPTPPPPPTPKCQLWQLQSVLTSAQWTSVQNYIAAQNNAALSAFFTHGTNMIPATSTTLLAIGENALSLTQAQIVALVTQASAISIP